VLHVSQILVKIKINVHSALVLVRSLFSFNPLLLRRAQPSNHFLVVLDRLSLDVVSEDDD